MPVPPQRHKRRVNAYILGHFFAFDKCTIIMYDLGSNLNQFTKEVQGLREARKGGVDMILAIGIALAVITGIVIQGLRRIPADPPHVAVVTFLGRPLYWRVKKPGWRLFLGYPYLFGFILVNVQKINFDLPVQKVITPDRVQSKVPVSITFSPNPDNDNLEEYIRSGREVGVKEILADIVQAALRTWAKAKDEGPGTWEDLIGSRDEAVALLLSAVIGTPLTEMCGFPAAANTVPPTIWWKFLRKPKAFAPTEPEVATWDPDWSKVGVEYDGLSNENKQLLDEAIVSMNGKIRDSRVGNGKFAKPELGIMLNRLNIGEIEPAGKLLEKMQLQAEEEQEREGQKVQITHIRDRITELTKHNFAPPDQPPAYLTPEAATELVQLTVELATKTISESKLNLSPETRAMIEKIGEAAIAKFLGGK